MISVKCWASYSTNTWRLLFA